MSACAPEQQDGSLTTPEVPAGWGPASTSTGQSPFAGMQHTPRPRASLASFHTEAQTASDTEDSSPRPQDSTSKLRLQHLHERRRPSLPFPLLALQNFKAEKRRRSAPKATVEQDESVASSPDSSRRGSMATVGIQMRPLAGPGMGGREMIAEGSGSSRRGKTKARSDSVIQREREAVEKWRKWALEQPPPASPTYDVGVTNPRRTSAPATALRYRTLSPSTSRTQLFDPALALHHHGLQGDLTPQRSSSSNSRPSTMEEHPLDDGQTTPTGISLRFSSFDDLAVDPTKINTSRPPVRPRVSGLPNPLVPLQKMLGARRTRPLMIELIHAVGLYVDAVWAVHRAGSSPPGVTLQPQDPQHPIWISPTLTAIKQAREDSILPPPTQSDILFYGTEVQEAVAEVEEALGGGKWSFARYLVEGGYGSVTVKNAGGEADVDWEHEGSGGPGMIRLLGDMEDVLWGDAPPRPTDIQFELPADFDPSATPIPSTQTETITALCDFLAEAPRQGLSISSAATSIATPIPASEIPPLQIPELQSVDALGQVKASPDQHSRGSDALLAEGRRRYRAWIESNQTGTVGA